MRAQEFINEDGFTPAQQAAQRAGMGTKAWVNGPPAAPSFNWHKVGNLAQAAIAVYNGYEEIMALPPTLSTEAKTKEITKIISRLSMEFGVGFVGMAIGAYLAGVVSGNALVGILGGATGAILASYYTGDTVGEISEFIAHTLYDQSPQPLPADPRTTQKKMKYPWMNEESAGDINPNTGKPYTPEEWARYWNPGAGRPYTEKEKEMFANPDVTAKSVGKEVLRRIPGIGALINFGDAVQGFKDLSR
jgi:hypothetical protein